MVTWSLISQLTPCARLRSLMQVKQRAGRQRASACTHTHKGAVVLLTLRCVEKKKSHTCMFYSNATTSQPRLTHHHCLAAQQTRARRNNSFLVAHVLCNMLLHASECVRWIIWIQVTNQECKRFKYFIPREFLFKVQLFSAKKGGRANSFVELNIYFNAAFSIFL